MSANKPIDLTIPYHSPTTPPTDGQADPHQSEDISSEPGKVTQKWSRVPSTKESASRATEMKAKRETNDTENYT